MHGTLYSHMQCKSVSVCACLPAIIEPNASSVETNVPTADKLNS
jgi:hypothetical protein